MVALIELLRSHGRKATAYGGLREHYELGSYQRCPDLTQYKGGRALSEVSYVPLRSVATDEGLKWSFGEVRLAQDMLEKVKIGQVCQIQLVEFSEGQISLRKIKLVEFSIGVLGRLGQVLLVGFSLLNWRIWEGQVFNVVFNIKFKFFWGGQMIQRSFQH